MLRRPGGTIKEAIPEPIFSLQAPNSRYGRKTIEIVLHIVNPDQMAAKGAAQLNYTWKISDMATIQETTPGQLVLRRAQNSGKMNVTVAIDNGGNPTVHSTTITVTEPTNDSWVEKKASS